MSYDGGERRIDRTLPIQLPRNALRTATRYIPQSDREQSTLAEWLKARPGGEIVTRDLSRAYAEAIADGAPDAA
jgi:hypothetical protein